MTGLLAGAVTLAAVLLFVPDTFTGAGSHASAATSSTPLSTTAAGCPNVRFTPYSLGDSYDGLPLTYSATVCNQPPSDAGPAVPFTDVIYGSCQAVSDYGCTAPLEIQSWPECRRNYGSYSNGPVDQQMNPSALTTLSALPDLPAAVFDGGTRLEMYTGDTTVVVFGDASSQVMAAGTALVPALTQHIAAALLGSQNASSVPSASAKALVGRTASAKVLRTEALTTPPPCATS